MRLSQFLTGVGAKLFECSTYFYFNMRLCPRPSLLPSNGSNMEESIWVIGRHTSQRRDEELVTQLEVSEALNSNVRSLLLCAAVPC